MALLVQGDALARVTTDDEEDTLVDESTKVAIPEEQQTVVKWVEKLSF